MKVRTCNGSRRCDGAPVPPRRRSGRLLLKLVHVVVEDAVHAGGGRGRALLLVVGVRVRRGGGVVHVRHAGVGRARRQRA